jgi:hypothetical protein
MADRLCDAGKHWTRLFWSGDARAFFANVGERMMELFSVHTDGEVYPGKIETDCQDL